jgi:hypothetical protein
MIYQKIMYVLQKVVAVRSYGGNGGYNTKVFCMLVVSNRGYFVIKQTLTAPLYLNEGFCL